MAATYKKLDRNELTDRLRELYHAGKSLQEAIEAFPRYHSALIEAIYLSECLPKFKNLAKPKRCEKGHLVKMLPCATCFIEGERIKNKNKIASSKVD